ncbi:Uncharacterised protein [Mycobacterium tuberculosis]|nr:Uncharacterised protein [Mycobacterium tuberculosis]
MRPNAAEAVGSGRSSKMRSTLGRSCPKLVVPMALPTIRPAICTAGSTSGNRSKAIASLPMGNEANRKTMLTSLVTPPALTRISRSTS